jgi:hypothetical protein
LIGWSHTTMDDNYIDKSFSCWGGVLEYKDMLDVNALGPVEWTVGPVQAELFICEEMIIHAWKIASIKRERERERVREESVCGKHSSFIADETITKK